MSSHPASQISSGFRQWALERAELTAALEIAREETAERERLLDRFHELERLIIETPASEVDAMILKTDILLWYMEMERDDGLPAMRHIRAFLEQLH